MYYRSTSNDDLGTYELRDAFFNQSQVFDVEAGGVGGVDNILAGIVAQNAQKFDRFVDEEVTNFLRFDVGSPRSDLVCSFM